MKKILVTGGAGFLAPAAQHDHGSLRFVFAARGLCVSHLELLISFRVLVSCSPQLVRRVQRIDSEVLPPCAFVAALVKLAMMKSAEWDGEFVTHFAPECPLLSKPKVMRIGRTATAGQTWIAVNGLA